MSETDEKPPPVTVYGTPEHAAAEVLNECRYAHEGYVSSFADDLAPVVVDGLRKRGFVVTAEPYCECGWTGVGNHQHDSRLGRADHPARDEPTLIEQLEAEHREWVAAARATLDRTRPPRVRPPADAPPRGKYAP